MVRSCNILCTLSYGWSGPVERGRMVLCGCHLKVILLATNVCYWKGDPRHTRELLGISLGKSGFPHKLPESLNMDEKSKLEAI